MIKKILQKGYTKYTQSFYHRTPPFIEESFYRFNNTIQFLKSIFLFPRYIFLSLAYHEKTREDMRIGIYKRLGVKIGKNIKLGKNVYFDQTALKYIEIGDNVRICDNVITIAHTHTPPYLRPYFGKSKWGSRWVKIEDGAIIEEGTIILPDVTIGKKATILEGSVVTKNVKENSIVGGMPAKEIHEHIGIKKAEFKFNYNEIKQLRKSTRKIEGNVISPKRALLKLAQTGIFPPSILICIYKIFGFETNGRVPDISPHFGFIGAANYSMILIEDDVHISPCVSIITKKGQKNKTILRRGTVIYAGATIQPEVEIQSGALVGAGSVVDSNISSHTVVTGAPATPKRNLREKTEKKIFDSIEITPFKFGYPGAFCISSDFELNWAWMHPKFTYDDGKDSRKNFELILNTFEKYNIPVTWCTVGHLFLKKCEKVGGKAHPDMPRPKGLEKDWYRYDPCTNWEKAPSWYAPDLIEKILKSKVKHEIGCHTFSHVYFSEDFCQPELANAEMKKCVDVMASWGLKPRSFAFPGNQEGNYSALERVGIIAYRLKNKDGTLHYPQKINNMWDIPPNLSLNLDFMIRGKKKRFDLATRYIDEAIETNKVAHFWFHPFFFSEKTLNLLDPVFKHIAEKNKENKLWLATMYEIATYCEAREKTTLNVIHGQDFVKIEIASTISHVLFENSEITLSIDVPKRRNVKQISLNNNKIQVGNRSCNIVDDKILLTCSTKIKSVRIDYSDQ